MEMVQKRREDQRAEEHNETKQNITITENALNQQLEQLKSQLQLMDDQLKTKAQESTSHLQIENELRNKNEQLLGQSR